MILGWQNAIDGTAICRPLHAFQRGFGGSEAAPRAADSAAVCVGRHQRQTGGARGLRSATKEIATSTLTLLPSLFSPMPADPQPLARDLLRGAGRTRPVRLWLPTMTTGAGEATRATSSCCSTPSPRCQWRIVGLCQYNTLMAAARAVDLPAARGGTCSASLARCGASPPRLRRS